MGVAVHLEFQQWHRSIHQSVEKESGNLFGGSRFFLVLLRAARCVFGQFGCRQVNLFPEKNHAIMITASSVATTTDRARTRCVWCLSTLHAGISRFSRARERVAERGPTSILFALDFTPNHVSRSKIY